MNNFILSELTKDIMSDASAGLVPDVDFDKAAMKSLIAGSKCTESDARREFRKAMGAQESTIDDITWWTEADVYTKGIFDLDVIFYGDDTVTIGYVAAKTSGYFFLFWEVLLKVCKQHGIKTINLCNRAAPGFWAYHGFTGSDSFMVRNV